MRRLLTSIAFLARCRLSAVLRLLVTELRRRMCSTEEFHLLTCELTTDVPIAFARRPVSLRPLEASDLAPLFAWGRMITSAGELKALLECYLFSRSGIGQGYAGVDREGTALVLCWLVYAEQNTRLQSWFDRALPPLDDRQALLEYVYTRPDCRGANLMAWISTSLFQLARRDGRTTATAYVRTRNRESMAAAQRIGWRITGRKRVRWRGFRRTVRITVFR